MSDSTTIAGTIHPFSGLLLTSVSKRKKKNQQKKLTSGKLTLFNSLTLFVCLVQKCVGLALALTTVFHSLLFCEWFPLVLDINAVRLVTLNVLVQL